MSSTCCTLKRVRDEIIKFEGLAESLVHLINNFMKTLNIRCARKLKEQFRFLANMLFFVES